MENSYFINDTGEQNTKHDNELMAIKEAIQMANELGVKVVTFKAIAQTEPKDITEMVTSYEAACAVKGIQPTPDNGFKIMGFTKDEISYRKLKTITDALNGEWRVNFADKNQKKHYPLFVYDHNSESLAYAHSNASTAHAYAYSGSRFCFKTRELAEFAGKTFINLYNDLIL